MGARILIVDDEDDVLTFVEATLENAGYDVITAKDGEDALHKWQTHRPDLIVLDVIMPGMTGFDVLRKIRENEDETPIVMLTSLDEIFDKQRAIKWRANQWVPKSERELLRNWVNLELRQLRLAKLECDDIRINFEAMQVSIRRDGEWKETHLEPKERKLLFFLARREGKVQLDETLQKRVFEREAGEIGPGTLLKTVSTLRKKIEPEEGKNRYIRTIRGSGYRFDA